MGVTGQVLCSLVLDQCGLFGSASQHLPLRRVIAACLLLIGGLLLSKMTNS